jgi:hypothetical protein
LCQFSTFKHFRDNVNQNTGQEDVKFSLEGSLKSLSEQLSNDRYQDNLQQIFLVLSTLPKQMEIFLYRLQNELRTTLTKEIQARIVFAAAKLEHLQEFGI